MKNKENRFAYSDDLGLSIVKEKDLKKSDTIIPLEQSLEEDEATNRQQLYKKWL